MDVIFGEKKVVFFGNSDYPVLKLLDAFNNCPN